MSLYFFYDALAGLANAMQILKTRRTFACCILQKAAWPSGLRRQLQALVRKGASSNLAAVTFAKFEVIFFRLLAVRVSAREV